MYWLVALGGAAGAVARVALGQTLHGWATATRFPWATLTANLLGAFLLGALSIGLTRGERPWMWWFAAAGFCGAFTTFSTFSLEVFSLWEAKRLAGFWGYLAASLAGGVGAVVLGRLLASALIR